VRQVRSSRFEVRTSVACESIGYCRFGNECDRGGYVHFTGGHVGDAFLQPLLAFQECSRHTYAQVQIPGTCRTPKELGVSRRSAKMER
jgi:hypothetical protein